MFKKAANIRLRYEPTVRHALKLAMPIVIGQLGLVLMGFFDTIQVGGLGANSLGATGLANSVYWQFILLGIGVLYAVSPLVSEAFGEEKRIKAIGVMKSATVVTILL